MTDSVAIGTQYIVRTPGVLGGDPHIAGRRIGVHDVANAHNLGIPVEEIAEMFNLTPAQVHAALAYYYDHRQEIDAILEENDRAGERLAAQFGDAERMAELQAKLDARRASPDHELTVTEIAGTYGINPRGVREAAAKGWIPARKSGSTWLIRRRDAQERWGKE